MAIEMAFPLHEENEHCLQAGLVMAPPVAKAPQKVLLLGQFLYPEGLNLFRIQHHVTLFTLPTLLSEHADSS